MKRSTQWIIIVLMGIFIITISVIFITRSKISEDLKKSITVGRSVGYCNLPLFVASERSKKNPRSLEIKLQYIANTGDHAESIINKRGPVASVTPFTNILVAYGNDYPVKIISGSGMNGLAIVSTQNITSIRQLAGKTIGTFRGDTLEILALNVFAKEGILDKVNFRYFSESLEPISALKNGELEAITHVEPFVSQLVMKENMNLLIRGEMFWENSHPDCVLMTTEEKIKKYRKELKILVLEMMKAQYRIENSIELIVNEVAMPFYNMSPAELIKAVMEQFPQIDIRDKKDFILSKSKILMEQGYTKNLANENLFDFTLLDEVIQENQDIFSKLKYKSKFSLNIN